MLTDEETGSINLPHERWQE